MSGTGGMLRETWFRRRGFSVRKYGLMIGLLFISVIISIITPNFLTPTNLLNILFAVPGTEFCSWIIVGMDFKCAISTTAPDA